MPNLDLKEKIREMSDWLVQTRRVLHMHPELGFEEEQTSKRVLSLLQDFGIPAKGGIAGTGVVGLLKGMQPGRTIAVRADMDGLPIQESGTSPYKSTINGKMHACGHDAHVAILLGVARFFSSAGLSKGNIKWIFQPAEEGGGGGRVMVKEGVLRNPRPDAVFAAHVFPFLQVGKLGIYRKEALASSDQFLIRILGKGAHAAYPHTARDPILAAGHMITQIHSIVSRNIDPLESGVITIGKVRGGTAANIIPDEVEIKGTIRSLKPAVRNDLKKRIQEVADGVSASFQTECRVEFLEGYPALLNDPEMSELVASAGSKFIGIENVHYLTPAMGSEDFSYFLQEIRGSFFRLGCRNEDKGIIHPNHSPLFDIDEDVLPFGVEIFVRVISEFLGLGIE